jgi:thiol-disulfide isomerase/thioredoxin
MTRSKSIIRVALLIFVWVSIGYALGKEVTVRRMQADAPGQVAPVKGDQVVVYYMFPAIRCVTCNQIHEAAHKVVHQDLADALESGRLRWEEVNISENEELAARYNVATSVVVVVHRRDGEDVSFQRLDDVWTLAEKPNELAAHIRSAVDSALAAGAAE